MAESPVNRRVHIVMRFVYLLLLAIILPTAWFILNPGSTNTPDVSADKQEMGIFTRYPDRVVAAIPSGGDYLVPAAHTDSFQLLSDDYRDQQVGLDSQRVYCGNRVMTGLVPPRTHTIANTQYYTDGQLTYYCSGASTRNSDLWAVVEVWQMLWHHFGVGEKPQSYIYPMRKLPGTSRSYEAVLPDDSTLVTDGETVYYKGFPMPEAGPAHLRKVARDFYVDGARLYYRSKLLPFDINPGALHPLKTSEFNNTYLRDDESGMIYVGLPHNDRVVAFDSHAAPYDRLWAGDELSHANQVLFAGADGNVYFFDTVDETVRLAGKNPIPPSYSEIAPGIYSNGRRILFLESSEVWDNGRRGVGLISRSTHVYELMTREKGDWAHFGNVYGGLFGSVWRHGKSLYYFDNLGDGQSISDAIYRIDLHAARRLLSDDIRVSQIRDMVRDDAHFTEVEHKELLVATTEFDARSRMYTVWIILAACGLVVVFVLWLLRKVGYDPSPFELTDSEIVLNSPFLRRRWSFQQIDEVVFAVAPSPRAGWHGTFRVRDKGTGKISRKYRFQAGLTILPEGRETVVNAIVELQSRLKAYGVSSRLVAD